MSYIDAFVIAVPKTNLEAYKAEVAKISGLWKEHGATSYTEALGDDAPMGELTSFPRAVQMKDGEVVILGMAVYPTAPRAMSPTGLGVALDRMFFGGFAPIVEA